MTKIVKKCWRSICFCVAKITDWICYDVVENRDARLSELQNFKDKPDELNKIDMKNTIMNIYATEKSSHLILIFTFVIAVLTIILLFKR